MGKCIAHEPCPQCGSRDNLARYADGTGYCFGCEYYDHGDGKIENGEARQQQETTKDWTPLEVTAVDIPKRGLRADTLEANDYGVGEYEGQPCQIANWRDSNGHLIAQKLRLAGKKFKIIGNGQNLGLWLMWKFRNGGKHIVITEGELDAQSMRQAQDNKWPVVSLPNGASSAEKAIAKDYDDLIKFDRIVLMFDMDKAGQEAVEKAAAMLPPGKVAVASLPLKDANEVLLADGPGALIRAFWDAPTWRPDGIRHISDIREAFMNPPDVRGIPYPWPEWTEVLGIMRLGALVTLTAGTGIGKSTFMRELIYHAAEVHHEPVGALMLEENNDETVEGLVSIHLNKNILADRKNASPEESAAAFDHLEKLPIFLYDHFGSTDVDNICAKIRYLVKACGVRWIFIDHLSILVSGLDGDERRTIDMAMTKLRTLVSELKIGMFCVVHLKRPQGDKGHEDGAEIHLGHLRGSHSIAQLSDAVVALNKSDEDPHGTSVYPVCMKNRRNGGRKGPMGTLSYNVRTGRLEPDIAAAAAKFDEVKEAA